MNWSTWVRLAAGWLALQGSAHAVLIDYGTAEVVTIRNCIAGATACDDLSAPLQIIYSGLPGAAGSSAAAALAGYGAAAGSVSLSGTVGAPVLHASASAEAGARTNTNSIAVQRYTYLGATATTRTFGGTLTYSQTLSGLYDPGVGDGIHAYLEVFTLPQASVEVGNTAESNYEALFSLFNLPGYRNLGWDVHDDTTSNTAGSATLDVAVNLDPGDSVWVFVLLQTPAPNGSTVDASHTLVTHWDNVADLSPAAVAAIPEPGAAALLAACAAAAAFARRRSRASERAPQGLEEQL